MIEIIIEGKAISWNKLYTAKHWIYRKRIADKAHKEVIKSCKKFVDKKLNTPIDVIIVAYFKDNRRRDVDNICSKIYIDGLVRAGLIKDDSSNYVSSVKTMIKRNSKNYIKIIIEENI